MSVDVTILEDTLSVEKGSATATRRVKIAWADIEDFMLEYLGAVSAGSHSFRFTHRRAHPQWAWLRAKSCSFKPFVPDDAPWDDSFNVKSGAMAEINYEAEEVDPPDSEITDLPSETFATWRIRFASEMMTIPGRHYTYSDGTALPADIDVGKRVGYRNHEISWKFITAAPWDAIRDATGKVNELRFLRCDPETLLFETSEATADQTTEGVQYHDLVYSFLERVIDIGGQKYGWNHVPKQDGTWDKIIDPNNNNANVYETFDMQRLFRLA